METGGMIRNDRYERIASSGIVFSGKSATKDTSKNDQLNRLLIRLIEEEFELSIRSQNCLNNAGVRLIGQLVQKSTLELLGLKNFGRNSLHELEQTLIETGLTLEMTLDFPPWNGDGNGAELIQILSAQCKGVGFQVNHEVANILGIDADNLENEALKIEKNVAVDKFFLISTALITQYLEERFRKGSPYLFDVVQRNKRWLQKELKKDMGDILSKHLKMIQGGNLK